MLEKKIKGQVVEEIIRNGGYKLTLIADRLHMSRATLYKKFRSDNLTDLFLFNLGKVIRFDFSDVFPELKNSVFYGTASDKIRQSKHQKMQDLRDLQDKYSQILEDYNKLLKFLVELMDENEYHSVKKEIGLFIKEHIKKKY